MVHNLIIIGSGPAGLTAAIYAGRANLNPLVLAGKEPGGQVTITPEVENYPGFPDGISGPEMANLMRKQAERFGAEIRAEEAVQVDLTQRPFAITTSEEICQSRCLIVATGAQPRRLGVPGEDEFTGRGVSYCATCDGFFFKGRDVITVGGGDAAAVESLFLTRFASSVRIVHRRDRLRAESILQERVMNSSKVELVWNSVVTEILGTDRVTGVRLRNVKSNEESELATDGVFVYIGHRPSTDLFRGQLELDEHGYIVTNRRMETSVEGVYAAGDVQDPVYRQAVTAAGAGTVAAIEAERFLGEHE